jgi:hypothetical protein|tara:strand:+ start:298 stop:984 length:687 start_codon:yes stop_codon:yes gene_type:complete
MGLFGNNNDKIKEYEENLANKKSSKDNYDGEQNVEKKIDKEVNTNKVTMNLSTTENCLLFDKELQNARDYVIENLGEDGLNELHNMVFANTIDTEWNDFKKVKQTINDIFIRRRYEVYNWFATKEYVKHLFPNGSPPIVNIDNNLMPPQTLQLGLYTLWHQLSPIKEEDENDEEFERRKDWHDYEGGYVNQEAIQRPLIEITQIFDELSKKREIIKNYMGIMFRSRNK